MIIEWKVTKKRGNHRPLLSYTIRLEDFERDLAVPQVVMESCIERPADGWRSYCYPNQAERRGGSGENYRLLTPDHKLGEICDTLRLSWRESGEYPEIEESFVRLRKQFELVLKSAYDSRPVECEGRMELSEEARKYIAGGVAAQRFLQAVGF